jgi:hypothetical protein
MARAKDQDDVKMNMARAKDQDDVKMNMASWRWPIFVEHHWALPQHRSLDMLPSSK